MKTRKAMKMMTAAALAGRRLSLRSGRREAGRSTPRTWRTAPRPPRPSFPTHPLAQHMFAFRDFTITREISGEAAGATPGLLETRRSMAHASQRVHQDGQGVGLHTPGQALADRLR